MELRLLFVHVQVAGAVTRSDEARKKGDDTARGCTSRELVGAWDDEYDGVVIDPASLPSCANAFASQLRASLAVWRSKVVINSDLSN